VRSFPAADQPGAGRESGQQYRVDKVAQFDKFGPVTQAAVAVEGGNPVVGGGDRGPYRLADGEADGELRVQAVFAQAADVGEERVAAARRITTDKDQIAVTVRLWDPIEGPVQHDDVVGGGVRSGVART